MKMTIYPMIMLLIKQCFAKIELQPLGNSPSQPINQLPSGNSKSFYIFADSSSYVLNVNNNFEEANLLQNKATTISTSMIRVNDSIIGIGCWDTGIVFIKEKEEGQRLAETQITFDPNFKCSFLQFSYKLYLLAYSNGGSIHLNFFPYNIETNAFSLSDKSAEITGPDQSIVCVLLNVDFNSCVYYNTKASILYYSNGDLSLSAINTLDLGSLEGQPFLFSSSNPYSRSLVLTLTDGNVYGHEIDYIFGDKSTLSPSKINLTLTKDLELATSVLKSLSVTKLITGSAPNFIFYLVAIGCLDTYCYCKYYDLDLKEQLKPFSIALNGGGTNFDVSLMFNNKALSILVSQSDKNYVVAYNYPDCTNLDAQYSHYTSEPFKLRLFANELIIKMTIEFSLFSENTIFLENSFEKVVDSKYYPVEYIFFDFPEANLYTMKYSLRDENDQGITSCSLFIYVCTFTCMQCYGFGTEEDPMCLTCARSYYSLYSTPSFCVTKETCLQASGFILELTKGSKCVTSCQEFNYLKDVEESTCVLQCKTTKMEDKIDKECLNEDNFNAKMDFYVNHIREYAKGLYEHYPLRLRDEYIMSIYNTSILPENYTLQAISLGSPYEVIFVSAVHLGKCEQFLKDHYDLNPLLPLLIAKFDRRVSSQISNEVEFFVFSFEGVLLDHSLCSTAENEITIISPITNEDSPEYALSRSYYVKGIHVFRSTDPFFNDICYQFTSEYLTDIPLIDRLDDMYLDKAILCNKGCEYRSIDYEKNTVLCSCSKEVVHLYKENYDNLFASLTSFWTQSNFAVVKCANLVFDFKKFANNIGSWFMIFLLIIEATSAIYFFLNEFKVIEKDLLAASNDKSKKGKDIIELYISQKSQIEEKNKADSTINNKTLNVYLKEKVSSRVAQRNMIVSSTHNLSVEESHKNLDELNHPSKKEIESKPNFYESMERDNMIKSSEINLNQDSHMIGNKLFENHKMNNDKSPNLRKTYNFNILNYPKKFIGNNKEVDKNSEERNNEDIRNGDAVHIYSRNGKIKCQTHIMAAKQNIKDLENKADLFIEFNIPNFVFFYLSFLRNLQPILRSFFFKSSLKTRVIPISMFFFCISVSFTLNALFFSDKYVSKSYKTQGGINFFFNMPKMIYSFILSYALKILFNVLSSIGSVISALAQKGEMNERLIIIRRLKMKLTIFYILKMLFISFFWYYVAAFCAVYPNIQMTWIISSLTTLVLEMIFPFGFSAALTILLIISTRYKVKWLISFSKNFSVS